MGGKVFSGLQAALLESSALALAEERATVRWLSHHAPDYAHGDPAGGLYEVPLGHPDAAVPAPVGPHHRRLDPARPPQRHLGPEQ